MTKLRDGQPVPKFIDFGVARATGEKLPRPRSGGSLLARVSEMSLSVAPAKRLEALQDFADGVAALWHAKKVTQ